MPAMGEWRTAIEAAISRDVADLTAVTFIDKLSTNAQPVKVIASDGAVYLIKGRQTRRVPVNEQIVAALAEALGAPVPPVMLIDLPAELIHAEPGMGHMEPGMSHASRWIDDCTDREGLRYFDVAENRPRFAALAVLYSWARASDHQWIYSKHHPNLVYSVDHGHFFPNGPDWTVEALAGNSDAHIDLAFDQCGLSATEMAPVAAILRSLQPSRIIQAVARPWHDWAISIEERAAMAQYLDRRRRPLADLLSR